jgi:hypothetical protein
MGADLRGATLDNAAFQWANLYHASITYEELQRLATSDALTGAMMPNGSRPFPAPPEAEDVLRNHPESKLAQRELELGKIARLLEQQARKREGVTMPDESKHA